MCFGAKIISQGIILTLKANVPGLLCIDSKNDFTSLQPFHARIQKVLSEGVQYILKMVSFGSKELTKEPKLECAYFLGQTS